MNKIIYFAHIEPTHRFGFYKSGNSLEFQGHVSEKVQAGVEIIPPANLHRSSKLDFFTIKSQSFDLLMEAIKLFEENHLLNNLIIHEIPVPRNDGYFPLIKVLIHLVENNNDNCIPTTPVLQGIIPPLWFASPLIFPNITFEAGNIATITTKTSLQAYQMRQYEWHGLATTNYRINNIEQYYLLDWVNMRFPANICYTQIHNEHFLPLDLNDEFPKLVRNITDDAAFLNMVNNQRGIICNKFVR